MRHTRLGLAPIGDVLVREDQIFRVALFVENGDATLDSIRMPLAGCWNRKDARHHFAAAFEREPVSGAMVVGLLSGIDVAQRLPTSLSGCWSSISAPIAIDQKEAFVLDAAHDERHRHVVDDRRRGTSRFLRAAARARACWVTSSRMVTMYSGSPALSRVRRRNTRWRRMPWCGRSIDPLDHLVGGMLDRALISAMILRRHVRRIEPGWHSADRDVGRIAGVLLPRPITRR